MNNNRVLLWDLGNVVVRWSPETILNALNYSPAETHYVRQSLLGHSDWLDLDRGVKTEMEVAQRMAADSVLSLDQSLRCFDVVRDSLVDIDQSVEMIGELSIAGIPNYVLSNMSQPNADMLRQRDYFRHFQGVVISAEEKLNKPATELFERVLNRYSLDANNVLFIDDTLVNIEAARGVGMEGLLFDGDDHCYASIRQFVGL